MIASILIIVLIIFFWCYFNRQSAPGITALRPYGIAAMLAIGVLILLVPQSPYINYLIAAESAIASLVLIATVGCVIAMAVGDYPTKNQSRMAWAIIVTLLVVCGWTSWFFVGMAALAGNLFAMAMILIGWIIALIRQR